ncbi:ATP-dependent DNA helicase HFM1/MER3 [Dendrobium catenatum]|uniref:ATP-dependent DNA helicase HFM1/MER3 n=1 Tax=Dendrobium catenatum TaxID=906689 RepID=A0A2I0X7L1_9ASPA|nr:ATP-dependent DNA helicase HFM1/MER3 [Dendrobium catenatum]
MQSCFLCGVVNHNGGLCLKNQNLVEGLFTKKDLHVLCATNILAHGVNLPVHTVVIKSTQYFNKKKRCLYLEYHQSLVLQACYKKISVSIIQPMFKLINTQQLNNINKSSNKIIQLKKKLLTQISIATQTKLHKFLYKTPYNHNRNSPTEQPNLRAPQSLFYTSSCNK